MGPPGTKNIKGVNATPHLLAACFIFVFFHLQAGRRRRRRGAKTARKYRRGKTLRCLYPRASCPLGKKTRWKRRHRTSCASATSSELGVNLIRWMRWDVIRPDQVRYYNIFDGMSTSRYSFDAGICMQESTHKAQKSASHSVLNRV